MAKNTADTSSQNPDSDSAKTPDMDIEQLVAEGMADTAEEEAPSKDDQIIALAAERDDMKDRMLRALADAENTRRRAEKDVRDGRVYAIERFAMDMLSVVDNLGRALDAVTDDARAQMGEAGKALLDGVELTQKGLLSSLERHGVKPVPGKGEKFDPAYHQAVAQIPADTPKGHVAEVMQSGFVLNERTLRAAMVAVSTGPAAGAPDKS